MLSKSRIQYISFCFSYLIASQKYLNDLIQIATLYLNKLYMMYQIF